MMRQAGVERDGVWESGFICYGVPVGTDKYVEAMMQLKVEEIEVAAEKAIEVLDGEKQALWTGLP